LDEVVLTSAFKLWGYSNWNQVKEYMDYNQTPFSLEDIKSHYEQHHYNQPDHLLPFPQKLPPASPHTPYGEVALKEYEQGPYMSPSESLTKRKESKC
jgi:hypothetical protein